MSVVLGRIYSKQINNIIDSKVTSSMEITKRNLYRQYDFRPDRVE